MGIIVTDRRVKNAVIRKMCKEWEIFPSLIWCTKWDYIDYDNELSCILNMNTIYKGRKYWFEFYDGCFNPYMVSNYIIVNNLTLK